MIFDKIFNLFFTKPKLNTIGLTRIRNESLIIQDTLDSMSQYVDGIIVYDDASTDNTVSICRKHPKVIEILHNYHWNSHNREIEETKSRAALLMASKKYRPFWLIYQDADERLEGNIREFLTSPQSKKIDGIKVRLFDAYLTKNDKAKYKKGNLYNFRQYFGPEYRDILMIWKNKNSVKYIGLDSREPIVKGNIITRFYCQHYGKSLSIKHWQDTCTYYVNCFPKYAEKWKSRLNKAIHSKSDFYNKLYQWPKVKLVGVNLHKS